ADALPERPKLIRRRIRIGGVEGIIGRSLLIVEAGLRPLRIAAESNVVDVGTLIGFPLTPGADNLAGMLADDGCRVEPIATRARLIISPREIILRADHLRSQPQLSEQ